MILTQSTLKGLVFLLLIVGFAYCKQQSSSTTGWDYNAPMNGGFQKVPYIEQETGPGLILIEGGTFKLVYSDQDTSSKEVVVASYYLDEKEVSNLNWCEYMYWTNRTFGVDYKDIYISTLPDTNCWRKKIGNSEAFELSYLRHPAYRNYPVVGVSWLQANNYCAWRTDRVNEQILIREGILLTNPNQQNEPFTTEAYLSGQYESGMNSNGQLPNLDPSYSYYHPGRGKFKSYDNGTRIVRMEDGILLPRYRLPTEAEWEYAACTKPPVSHKVSKKEHMYYQMHVDLMGDFVRGESRILNNAWIVAPVDAFLPNDIGIYGLAGNVSEWVMDTYQERNEFNVQTVSPFCGEPMKVFLKSDEDYPLPKYDQTVYDIKGMQDFMEAFMQSRKMTDPLDSLELRLCETINVHLAEASDTTLKDAYGRERSHKMVYLMNGLFQEVHRGIQAQLGLYDYEMDIIPILRAELSKFILDTPGNMRKRNLTPEEQILVRNNNYNTKILKADSSLIDYFAQEPSNFRVIKGPSWLDQEDWISVASRKNLNKYGTACNLGFRCAMDRIGSPVGLSKKNKGQE